jgi:hypothetical protein
VTLRSLLAPERILRRVPALIVTVSGVTRVVVLRLRIVIVSGRRAAGLRIILRLRRLRIVLLRKALLRKILVMRLRSALILLRSAWLCKGTVGCRSVTSEFIVAPTLIRRSAEVAVCIRRIARRLRSLRRLSIGRRLRLPVCRRRICVARITRRRRVASLVARKIRERVVLSDQPRKLGERVALPRSGILCRPAIWFGRSLMSVIVVAHVRLSQLRGAVRGTRRVQRIPSSPCPIIAFPRARPRQAWTIRRPGR